MDTSQIRTLILSTKWTPSPNLSFGHIAETIISEAVRKGILDRHPQHNAEASLKEKIEEVTWGLVIEGVFAPNHTLPLLRITEYGKQCFEAGETTPHDPDEYISRLRKQCPSIDAVTLLYVGEGLQTFRAGNHLATAVMIGVAAEKTLLRLVDAVHFALDTPLRQQRFEEETKGKKAKKQHDELLKRLKSPLTPLASDLESVVTQHIDGIFDVIRRSRNDAGHPTGRKMDRQETHALLLLFPTYCKTAHDLIDWLSSHKI